MDLDKLEQRCEAEKSRVLKLAEVFPVREDTRRHHEEDVPYLLKAVHEAEEELARLRKAQWDVHLGLCWNGFQARKDRGQLTEKACGDCRKVWEERK